MCKSLHSGSSTFPTEQHCLQLQQCLQFIRSQCMSYCKRSSRCPSKGDQADIIRHIASFAQSISRLNQKESCLTKSQRNLLMSIVFYLAFKSLRLFHTNIHVAYLLFREVLIAECSWLLSVFIQRKRHYQVRTDTLWQVFWVKVGWQNVT